jgi:hypothetical protein
MPVVFVIAGDWKLRTAVRAELREIGVNALGIDAPDDAAQMIASGTIPVAIVLEATGNFVSDSAIQSLVSRIPTIWIASRTEKIPFPSAGSGKRSHSNRGVLLYRPARIGDIVAHVRDILKKGQAA